MGPSQGSDAGSISSSGEVFKGEDGKLYIRLSCEKRYITLAAISTVIGLAIILSAYAIAAFVINNLVSATTQSP